MASLKTTQKAPRKKSAVTWRSPWIWLSAAAAAVFLIAAGVFSVIQPTTAGGILPGVVVASADLTGDSPDQTEKNIRGFIDEQSQKGFVFEFENKKTTITPTVVSAADPDLAYDVVTFDADKTMAQAKDYGRTGAVPARFVKTFAALLGLARVPLAAHIDRDKFIAVLKENFGSQEQAAQQPKFVKKDGAILVEPGSAGTAFDYEAQLNELEKQLRNGAAPAALTLTRKSEQPLLSVEEAGEYVPQVQKIIKSAPVTLTVKDKSYAIDEAALLSWLTFGRVKNKTKLILDPNKVAEKLIAIAAEVEVASKEGKFTIEGGRVKEFQVGAAGWGLDRAASVAAIENGVMSGATTVALAGQDVDPRVKTADTGDLDIKEIIGVGRSNMSGSPVNRRYNIALGAATLNGVLIKPGEVFSLIKTLGKIDASTGYRAELVIKGNKTTPEFGGGLCQIGTTTFRAALASGLPVVERQSHSYRVRYYEPAGTDATIYDPRPDLRFINDTGHFILIQTKIDGDDISFEFWGTKDGRKAEQTKPVVSNIVAPPPMKTVETTDLKPGEKKCTELAHNGADAVFYYTITYPNGEVKKQEFKSHYKPWQAVCLVGVKEKKPDKSAPATTNANTNTNTNASTGGNVNLDVPAVFNN